MPASRSRARRLRRGTNCHAIATQDVPGHCAGSPTDPKQNVGDPGHYAWKGSRAPLGIPRDRKGVCEEAEGLVAEDLPRVSAEIAAAPDVITLVDKPPADPPVRRVECSFENRPRRPAGEINKKLGG